MKHIPYDEIEIPQDPSFNAKEYPWCEVSSLEMLQDSYMVFSNSEYLGGHYVASRKEQK